MPRLSARLSPRLGLAVLAFAACAAAASPETAPVGFAEMTIADPDRPLEAAIWHPAVPAAEARLERIAENPVWRGFDAFRDVPPAPGAHPLVVLSHGLDGNWRNQGWLATALAARGYVVAGLDHPGTSTWSRDPAQAAALWRRPEDLSRLIDAVLAHPRLGGAVDAGRVGAIGHSLGGFTVMALGGARFDLARHDAYCESAAPRAACRALAAWEIGTADAARLADDMRDPRIDAVVSLDLGLAQGFTPDSLAAFETSVLVVGAGRSLPDLPVEEESRALAAALPATTTRYVEPAARHMDFVGLCKPGAAAILEEEEPEAAFICEDGDAPRAALHAALIEEIATFLEEAFAAP